MNRRGAAGTRTPLNSMSEPAPGDGHTSQVRASAQQLFQLSLVDDVEAERLRLVELGAGLLARDDVVGLLAHGRGHTPAARFDQRPRLVARQRLKPARQNELLAREGPVRLRADAPAGQLGPHTPL